MAGRGSRGAAWFAGGLLGLAGFGCDGGDTRAVRDAVRLMDELTDSAQGEAAAAQVAPESLAHYDRLVKLALDAPANQVRNLPATEKIDILMMRNRLARKELAAIDGRGWIVHAVNQGWWRDEESWDADRVRVRGPSATARALIDGDPTDMTLRFVKVEGRWLEDYRHADPNLERNIRDFAEMEGVTVDELLVQWEGEETGKPVKRNIWDPPKK